MKNAIAVFIKEHPFITFWIIDSACSAIVKVAQAISGNYPPEKEVNYPSVEVNVQKPQEEEAETTILEGEVSELDPVLS